MNHSRLVRSAVIAPAIALVLGPAPGAGGPTSGVLIHRWEQTYEASLFTGPVGIGTTRDGTRVFAAGNSGESEYISWHDYVALAYDGPTGAEIWRAFLERPPEKNLTAVAMGVSSDGARVFVTGNGPGVGPNEGKGAFTTVAFDGATGERLWVASYSGPGARNAASNLALSGD